jgi:hypothetical protein
LVGLYAAIGGWAKGEAAYAELQASPYEYVKADSFTSIHAARLRWGQGQDPAPLLAEALRSAREGRFLFAEREAQRLAGEVAFARGDLTGAQEVWQAAYAIAQREGVSLGPFLADLARLHAAQQDGTQAKALLTEALALRGPGVALAAVEVYTALGEPAEARRSVEAAYREAWADGPPYAFVYELARIRAALKTLGLAEPQLPPFDARRIPPLPDEAQIRAFIEELNADERKTQGRNKQRRGSVSAPDGAREVAAARARRSWWPFGKRQ